MTEIYKDGARIDSESRSVHDTGPTRYLRDQFAMAALTGLMVAGNAAGHDYVAGCAYVYADAMMKARNGKAR